MSTVSGKAYSVVGLVLLLEFLIQFYYIAAAIVIIAARADSTNAQVVNAAVYGVNGFLGIYPVIWDPLVFLNGIFAIPITILILIGLSFGARHPRRTTALTALLFLVLVIDGAIFFFTGVASSPCSSGPVSCTSDPLGGSAVLAGLHYIDALILTGLGLHLVMRNWVFGRRAGPGAAVRTMSERGT